MGRAGSTRIRRSAPKPPAPTGEDATPERLAHDEHVLVETKVQGQTVRVVRERRFLTSHLDRLYRNRRLTYRQFHAGEWYREQHHACRFAGSAIAAYGERVGAPLNPAAFGYGLPTAQAAAHARKLHREARAQLPARMVGYVDRLLLHDEMPKAGWRAQARTIGELGAALDLLADWLKVPANAA